MNPFTGDSYAYFHGGHNLGEQGTISPIMRTARRPEKRRSRKRCASRQAGRRPMPRSDGRRATTCRRSRQPVSYIDGNLLEGERVVFRTRLHWKLLVGPALFLLATLVPPAWLYLQQSWTGWVLIAPAAGLVVLLAAIVQTNELPTLPSRTSG